MRQRTWGLLVVLALAGAGCGARYTYTEGDGRQLRIDRTSGRTDVLVRDADGFHWRAVQEPAEHVSAHAALTSERAARGAALQRAEDECRARELALSTRRAHDRPRDVFAQIGADLEATGLLPPVPPVDRCHDPYARLVP